MNNSKFIDTLVDKGLTLSIEDCPKTDEEKRKMCTVPYASVVGSLCMPYVYKA